jgi:transposase-like protein
MSAPKYTQEQREHVIALAQQGYSTIEISQEADVRPGTVKKWMAGHFNHAASRARGEKTAFEAELRAPPDKQRPLPPGAVKVGGHVWLKLTGWGAR